VPVGGKLRLFGAVHRTGPAASTTKTNYRRWSNNPWSVVEPEGQPKAGSWTAEDASRLDKAVRTAHDAGLWIRFYTLDGFDPLDESSGWSQSYNFGSTDRARERWRAAIAAGVDFVAVDQYEEFARVLHAAPAPQQ
jgi:glycerophosphoryl diester phosphodiesterase